MCFHSAVKLIIFLFFSLKFIASADEVHLDRVELRNASYIPGLYNVSLIRIAKFNRTAYAFNLIGDLSRDISNKH